MSFGTLFRTLAYRKDVGEFFKLRNSFWQWWCWKTVFAFYNRAITTVLFSKNLLEHLMQEITNGVLEACWGTWLILSPQTPSSVVRRQTPAPLEVGTNPAVLHPSCSRHFLAQSAGDSAGMSLDTFNFGRDLTGEIWNSTLPWHFLDSPCGFTIILFNGFDWATPASSAAWRSLNWESTKINS